MPSVRQYWDYQQMNYLTHLKLTETGVEIVKLMLRAWKKPDYDAAVVPGIYVPLVLLVTHRLYLPFLESASNIDQPTDVKILRNREIGQLSPHRR